MSDGIIITNLSKTYSDTATPALDHLNIRISAGEVYGFLGANGAGKSTTIKLLLNFLQPSGGSASIQGLDSVSDSVAVKKQVGYLAGDVALWPNLSAKDALEYLLRLQNSTNKEYLWQLIKKFELNTTKKIGELSKGNRQKVGIIQALMHKPSVLILDEPTSGIDPLMQEVFYDAIADAKTRGAAVFLSSHNLAEAQRICDRIGIIKQGRLVHEQKVDDESLLNTPVFVLTLGEKSDIQKLKTSKALEVLRQEGQRITVRPTGALPEALAALSTYSVTQLVTQQLNLEDDFLEFYGDPQ